MPGTEQKLRKENARQKQDRFRRIWKENEPTREVTKALEEMIIKIVKMKEIEKEEENWMKSEETKASREHRLQKAETKKAELLTKLDRM